MRKIIGCLLLLAFAGDPVTAQETSNQESIEEVDFIINQEQHIGVYFDSATQQFIRPAFLTDQDNRTFFRVWKEYEKNFSPGNILRCKCKGKYYEDNGVRWFQVYRAEYYKEMRQDPAAP